MTHFLGINFGVGIGGSGYSDLPTKGLKNECAQLRVGTECQVVYLLVEIGKPLHLRNGAQAFEIFIEDRQV